MAEGGVICDEPGGVLRQGSVSSQQTLVHWENASVETCNVMNMLGYGSEIIQARRDIYRERGRLNDAVDMTCIITGSKAEGLTCMLESDTDRMYVLKSVICLEDGVNVKSCPKEITVLRSYSRTSYPGHCKLLLESRGTKIHRKVKDALCDDGYGRELLCSDIFVNNWTHLNLTSDDIVQHDRAGPSIPRTSMGAYHFDTVQALRYDCRNIFSKWSARPRHWPPPEAVQKVVSLGAFLTPVGFKGSEYQHVEWRICFNAGEIELVNNLNDIQIKLYVLLKMVKNDVLHPRKKEVSSYTLKNIVLWIAENNHQSLFHKRSLLHWLHEGLDALRVALVTRTLPYYMIPERNLMAASGLKDEQQRIWISTITEMMNEGPMMILRLPKIRKAIIAHPEPLRWYNRKRIEIELMCIMYINISLRSAMENGLGFDRTSVIQDAIFGNIRETASEVRRRMIMEGSRVNNMWEDVIKRMLM